MFVCVCVFILWVKCCENQILLSLQCARNLPEQMCSKCLVQWYTMRVCVCGTHGQMCSFFKLISLKQTNPFAMAKMYVFVFNSMMKSTNRMGNETII